jgi:hypothetical protein
MASIIHSIRRAALDTVERLRAWRDGLPPPISAADIARALDDMENVTDVEANEARHAAQKIMAKVRHGGEPVAAEVDSFINVSAAQSQPPSPPS